MMILKIDALEPDAKVIRAAADALRRGELVIFPTETVYGLAADATNDEAVKRVFDAKGRLDSEPLPVQVARVDDLLQVATFVPDNARRLADLYWPGPLTLVMQKNPGISDLVTGGRETVGVRIPAHPVALALIKALGSPIVATSANVSGNNPPMNAVDAINEVGNDVTVVLDAGESRLGVASTIVDVSTMPPRILRRGTIGEKEIRDVLGDVETIAE